MNHQKPTALQEQANADAIAVFAEQLKQFKADCENLHQFERDLPATALQLSGRVIQADDGTKWQHDVKLMENISFSHRRTATGLEFAVVESMPLKSGERQEVLNNGHNSHEVLQTFTRDQRLVLQLWKSDVVAQVYEHLAEKYPHQDMSIVAKSFEIKLARAISQKPTLAQTQSRGVRI